jgi:hypothetical protein
VVAIRHERVVTIAAMRIKAIETHDFAVRLDRLEAQTDSSDESVSSRRLSKLEVRTRHSMVSGRSEDFNPIDQTVFWQNEAN